MAKEEGRLLTGDRPTGKLHLGHFVGSIQNRIALQDKYESCFYMIADVQALTDNADNPEKVRSNLLEVAMDNLACGLDPAKTTYFVQSLVPEIAELTIFFLNLVTLARLERNPTVKSEMKDKGFGADVPVGFLAYPISQAADILFCKASIVPVGDDQKPVLEQVNEIVDKFNRFYGEVFKPVKMIASNTPRLVGLDGGAKMSKSLGNTINLSASDKEIADKVMSMYTDPAHIHVSDPGKVEGNVVFTYLDIFDPNKAEVTDLKTNYAKGGLGDIEIKKRLTKVLQDLIGPIRERRKEYESDPKKVEKILQEGTAKAREIGAETMKEIRKAMKINYF